jgi:hypothetical protein
MSEIRNIIGTSLRVGEIEVAEFDFPDALNLEDAKNACLNLGEGWRLPTKEELNLLYMNKEIIGNFGKIRYYWSSTPGRKGDNVWGQNFNNGKQYDDGIFNNYNYVRAVRIIKQ